MASSTSSLQFLTLSSVSKTLSSVTNKTPSAQSIFSPSVKPFPKLFASSIKIFEATPCSRITSRNVAASSGLELDEELSSDGDDEQPQQNFSPDLKLFVGNLPFSVDSAALAGLFEGAGNVEMVEVIYDKVSGRSRGFGFVTMSSVEEVEEAVRKFNGYELEGRAIRVNSGPPPRREESGFGGQREGGRFGGGSGGGRSFDNTNRVYVGNLAWSVDNLALETLFREQGNVVEAKVVYDRESGRSRGFGQNMSVDPFSEPLSKLSDAVIYVAKTTANFKPQLTQLKTTLEKINPIIHDIKKLNRQLDQPDIIVYQIDDAKKLVLKCLKIKFNLLKKFTHSLKLKDVNDSLLRSFQIEVQADQCRDIKQTLVAVNHVSDRIASLSMDFRNLGQTLSSSSSSSSSFMSVSSRLQQCGSIERQRLGWPVPALPRCIVAFKEPLEKLKAKVLAGIDDDYDSDSMDIDTGERVDNVVVVSAAGGFGKTTLVKMLCHDDEIQEKFRENVFFVTVSETPNFMVIVNDLFNPNSFGLQVPFQSSEDSKNKLNNFLRSQVSRPILLVLDDVWSDSFIKNFEFDISGYKVVVTSRRVFNKYDVFQFDPLSDEDAKTLFRLSARPGPAIGENLVNQMVKCCKKHPLTLSVIGSSLAGKDETVWIHMLNIQSRGKSILDLNDEVLNRLERSFEALDDKFKQCYLDFGLFLEDQRIPASALLNMWAHLYNHDDEGVATLARICELSYRNLVNLTTTGLRRESSEKVNYCEQQNYCEKQFVSQHDLLRQLAIKLSSKSPIAQRPRLIISAYNDILITNVQGEDMPVSVEKVQEPLEARIMSISTGESFSSKWCNLKAPNVEVMVLNLMSKTYALPHFLNKMQKMRILNVTNHGVYPTEFKNSHFLGCLSNLVRIRLERVVVSSLSTSLGALVNLQKVSFIMCNMGNGFEKLGIDKVNIWPRLVEIEMDYCQDLVEFPDIMCNSVYLKRLSITNCNEMSKISEEFGKLTSLESLSLRSCTKLEKLPESIARLQNLNIIDISDCLSLSEFPEEMGNLAGLETIYMKGCTGVVELPQSVNKLSKVHVVCNEEISYQWQEFPNVKIHLVEENRLDTLMKII